MANRYHLGQCHNCVNRAECMAAVLDGKPCLNGCERDLVLPVLPREAALNAGYTTYSTKLYHADELAYVETDGGDRCRDPLCNRAGLVLAGRRGDGPTVPAVRLVRL